LDCVVIGAGVVGLATARELALAGRDVVILESEDRIGTGISSRNSEVIHAGMYYEPNSLKAILCAPGNRLLYQYCANRGVSHQRCGKLIVATHPDQLPHLMAIRDRGEANGVQGLELLSREAANEMEPELDCHAALLSPWTGIVDSHGLMKALLLDAEQHGATLVLANPLKAWRTTDQGLVLDIGCEEPTRVLATHVFNCAGLSAVPLAHRMEGHGGVPLPSSHLAKGNYFALSGRAPFSRLVYPVPEAAGLGVHLTLDLAGQARFGPDVEWVDSEQYDVDPGRSASFYSAIRKYWPGLPDDSLQPAYAGIRPKLHGPGEATRDFLILGPQEHGIPGLVHLLGIESPGLTACLSLAARVTQHLAAS
jgi:L-2-hydroxyglutarate oxidase LhgO